MAPLELEVIEAKQSKPIGKNVQRLIPTYGAKLKNLAAANEDIVVLDADLLLDTGLGPFADTFPDRLIECGIAEQDMVSQAGGLALSGRLPIVHSLLLHSVHASRSIITPANKRKSSTWAHRR